MYIRDTIAAISTPLGEGGIGIVRLSGDEAQEIAGRILRRKKDGGLKSHRFYYGTLIDPETGELIDEALLVYMQQPRSYTAEDVVELQCHGGYLVVQRVLSLVLRQGARLAEPGEFTRRAFLNGRIDLVQAEATIDLIRSKTDAALSLAQRQREGFLSARIGHVRDHILHCLALVEAFVDFPEEELDGATIEEIVRSATTSCDEVRRLVDGFNEGKVLREGVSVLIAGKPNVGKSSLLNTLLREKRAIVTSIPGTTRDVIEEVVNIGGLPVRLLDTAGIRSTDDAVEQIGIGIAIDRIAEADLIIFLVDSSRPWDDDDQLICQALLNRRYFLVKNKTDLPCQISIPSFINDPALSISTATGDGVDELRSAIRDAFLHGHVLDSRDSVGISHVRHRDALEGCLNSLARFLVNLKSGFQLELLAVDLRDSLHSLGQVTGETTPDDILDLIFNRFCIGK